MKSRLATSIFVLAVTAATMSGGVLAWLTDSDTTPTNRFQGGVISISANETLIPAPLEISNWYPGDTVKQDYVIQNTGTLPIYLRASFTGAWVPLSNSEGKHSNTATVTGSYKGQEITAYDKAHYYVSFTQPAPIVPVITTDSAIETPVLPPIEALPPDAIIEAPAEILEPETIFPDTQQPALETPVPVVEEQPVTETPVPVVEEQPVTETPVPSVDEQPEVEENPPAAETPLIEEPAITNESTDQIEPAVE